MVRDKELKREHPSIRETINNSNFTKSRYRCINNNTETQCESHVATHGQVKMAQETQRSEKRPFVSSRKDLQVELGHILLSIHTCKSEDERKQHWLLIDRTIQKYIQFVH